MSTHKHTQRLQTIIAVQALVIALLIGGYVLPSPSFMASMPSFLQFEDRNTTQGDDWNGPHDPGHGLSADDGAQSW